MPSISRFLWPKDAAVRFRKRPRSPELRLRPGQTYRFPAGFLWGAATSSHQVEGLDQASDWWRFERQPRRTRNFTCFPRFARRHKSDHWRRFERDIERMQRDLGLSAYRFSIDWSRVEPREGQFDGAVIDRYAALCARMRQRGIAPFVTLFHWSSPDWIWDHSREERSGWYEPRIVDRFARFCAAVVPALSPHVEHWVTLNEPNVFLYGGFAEGMLAPGHRSPDEQLLPVLRHLLACHVAAHRLIKEARPDARVGVAHQLCPFAPARNWNPLERLFAARVEQAFSWSLPDALRDGAVTFTTRSGRTFDERVPDLAGTADFCGVNFYEQLQLRLPWGVDLRRAELLHDHFDDRAVWPRAIHTAAFVDVLQRAAARYRLPLVITENGRAHPDDRQRREYLAQHLRALGHAIDTLGLDVRGFFYWSLLDNQEWAHGFVPRMGLYEVDFADGRRSLRDTGRFLAEVIARGAISS